MQLPAGFGLVVDNIYYATLDGKGQPVAKGKSLTLTGAALSTYCEVLLNNQVTYYAEGMRVKTKTYATAHEAVATALEWLTKRALMQSQQEAAIERSNAELQQALDDLLPYQGERPE